MQLWYYLKREFTPTLEQQRTNPILYDMSVVVAFQEPHFPTTTISTGEGESDGGVDFDHFIVTSILGDGTGHTARGTGHGAPAQQAYIRQTHQGARHQAPRQSARVSTNF